MLALCAAPLATGLIVGLWGGRLTNLVAFRARALWIAVAAQAAQYYAPGVRAFFEQTLGVSMLLLVFALVGA